MDVGSKITDLLDRLFRRYSSLGCYCKYMRLFLNAKCCNNSIIFFKFLLQCNSVTFKLYGFIIRPLKIYGNVMWFYNNRDYDMLT